MIGVNDITDLITRYRLALCHIWNTCVWVDPRLRNWESVYSFRDIRLPLFKALIADPLGLDTGGTLFGSAFSVVVGGDTGESAGMIEVNTSEPKGARTGIWTPLQGPIYEGDISLTLIDLYDWRPLSYMGLSHYMVLITAFDNFPEHVGRHALIAVDSARVFCAASVQEVDSTLSELC